MFSAHPLALDTCRWPENYCNLKTQALAMVSAKRRLCRQPAGCQGILQSAVKTAGKVIFMANITSADYFQYILLKST